MTVGELKKCLELFSDDLMVVVDGYESGFTELTPSKVKRITLALNKYDDKEEWYFGRHEDTQVVTSPEDYIQVSALALRR